MQSKRESTSRCDLQKGIVKSPSCKSYELFSTQVVASDKIERQASEILECSSRSTEKSFEVCMCPSSSLLLVLPSVLVLSKDLKVFFSLSLLVGK